MIGNDDEWPDWLVQQRGKRRRQPGYFSRRELTRRWVKHLRSQGLAVDHAAMRRMLAFVDRGYSLKPDQISRALAGFYKSGTVAKMPNGKPVIIDGTSYPSARSAAEALGISPQTVLNRLASTDPQWVGWKRGKPGKTRPEN